MSDRGQSPYVFRATDDAIVARRMHEGVFVIGAFVAVVVVGLLAAVVTWTFHPKAPAPCTANCPPPKADVGVSAASGEALAEQKSFKSTDFGFTVEYPADWDVSDSGSSGVLLSTRHGILELVGTKTTAAPAQLILDRIGRFNSARLPDIQQLGPLRGAHIGTQEGQGSVFKATLLPSSGGGTSILVRIAIVVAKRAGVTVLATTLLPYDANSDTIVGAGEVDYALTEFRWQGQ